MREAFGSRNTLDHETHENPRKVRKAFVTFAAFRTFRDPKAPEATAAGDTARVREVEVEIDQLAAALWGLSQQELEEIQRSLEELG